MNSLTNADSSRYPSTRIDTDAFRRPHRRTRRQIITTLFFYLLLVTAAVLVMIPVIWLVVSSLKTNAEFNAYPIQFLPALAQWINYQQAWEQLQFVTYGWNTLKLAALFTVLNVASSAFAGFGFARHQAPGRQFLFTLMLSTMMVPAIITIIPQFILYSRFGIVGSYWPWVLWGIAGNPFQIFLFRQFFASFPKELEDAAEVDGCSPLGTFFRIFIPNAGSIIAVTAIFSFQWVWGDFFLQSIFLDASQTTLAVKLSTAFSNPRGLPEYTLTMAGIVMYVLPLILIYFFAQRHIIRGIVTTGLK